MEGKKKGKEGRELDSTLRICIRDPKLEGIRFISPPLRLYTLKQHLQKFQLAHSNDPAGFSFDNFRNNIQGIKSVIIDETGADVLFTRTSAFLTVQGPPGALRIFSPLTGTELFSRASLAASEEGLMLTICRISGNELKQILKAAGADCSQQGLGGLLENHADIGQFSKKLAGCAVISKEDGFDLCSFAGRISTASVFQDEDGRSYLIIAAEGEECVYSLNAGAPQEGGRNPLACTLRYLGEPYCLCRIEVIG